MSGVDHLLRTLASIPPGIRLAILDEGEAEAEALATQLGFSPVRLAASSLNNWPEAAFDWILAVDPWGQNVAEATIVLPAVRQLVVPGGWVYALLTRSADSEALTQRFVGAGFAVAEPACGDPETGGVHGIYRRVEAETQH